MKDMQNAVITLIRAALAGEKQALDEDFDLGEAVTVAKNHGIPAILYYGAYYCGITDTEPRMEELFQYTGLSILRNQQQSYEISRIFDRFNEAQIDYMPLKGVLLGNMYPKSEMRMISDVDILIKPAQYKKIRNIMLELDFKEAGESDHEIKWVKPTLYVELHNKLIPSYNKDYYAYFRDGWQFAKCCDGTCYSMTKEDQMIYLFTHFAKHYRDAGIGIKHLVDLWVYRKNTPDLNETYIKNELEKLRLKEFYENILCTLGVWFENKQGNPITEMITDFIFDSTAGGTKENAALSSTVRFSKRARLMKNIKLQKIWNTVFCPYRKMCVAYPFLKKFPVALPVMWAVRVFSKVFQKDQRTAYRQEMHQVDIDSAKQHEANLNFVGLNFDFKR